MNVDLSTRYLGFELANPLVASASPLTGDLDTLYALEDAGASAVVLPSLFEEQIEHQQMAMHALYESLQDGHGEAATYFPELETYNSGPESYLALVANARKSLRVPVIASLNGTTNAGWVRYAKRIEEAGASALELNVYLVAADPEVSAAQVEERYLDLVRAVRTSISIPLAVKVGPHFSSFANMARKLVDAGAQGLVLFNRFLHPDIDLETLEVKPDLELSTPSESRLAVRWVAILRGRVKASLAATGGAHGPAEVAKLLLAGADVVMMASALLRQGPGHLKGVRAGLQTWLEEKEYLSVEQMKGSLSQVNSPDPGAFERANYMKALTSFGNTPR